TLARDELRAEDRHDRIIRQAQFCSNLSSVRLRRGLRNLIVIDDIWRQRYLFFFYAKRTEKAPGSRRRHQHEIGNTIVEKRKESFLERCLPRSPAVVRVYIGCVSSQ